MSEAKTDEPLDVTVRIPREHVGRFRRHAGRIRVDKPSVVGLALILAGLDMVEQESKVEPRARRKDG